MSTLTSAGGTSGSNFMGGSALGGFKPFSAADRKYQMKKPNQSLFAINREEPSDEDEEEDLKIDEN